MNPYERRFTAHIVGFAVLSGVNILLTGVAAVFRWEWLLNLAIGITAVMLYSIVAALYWGRKALQPRVSRNRKESGIGSER